MNLPARRFTVAYLTAGGAGMYCGSCMRDNTVARFLNRLQCETVLVPLYTPIRTDEEDVSLDKVFFGGINVYLEQRFSWFRRVPKMFVRWLDSPRLLRFISRWQIQTQASELGEMTLSMLRGEAGYQKKEIEQLVTYLQQDLRPKLVNFSNLLIAGCLPAIKRALNVPVVVTLQGDDLFYQGLPDRYQQQVLALLSKVAQEVDAFIVFSDYYRDVMAATLQVDKSKFHLVPLGLDVSNWPAAAETAPERPLALGYFARICPAKGFDQLVTAFMQLADRPGLKELRLLAAGWLGEGDRTFFAAQTQRLKAAGLEDRFEYWGAVDRAAKQRFFHSIDLLSVPTQYKEPKGLYVLEALASGVPVVQPAHGAFPELIPAQAGLLVPPGDTSALAAALERLLLAPLERAKMGAVGREFVQTQAHAQLAAQRTLAVYERVLQDFSLGREPAPLASESR